MKHAHEIRRATMAIFEECKALVPEHTATIDRITVKMNKRLTRRAGQARPFMFTLDISVPYFADDQNFEQHLRETVTHELAHILSPPIRKNGRWDQHGAAWKSMHRILGGKGERCHKMQLATGYTRRTRGRAERKAVPCSCGCGETMMLGPTQYKRALAGALYYMKGHAPKGTHFDPFRL